MAKSLAANIEEDRLINLIAVTSAPRHTSQPVLHLTAQIFKPSTGLISSVVKNKKELYAQELTDRYKDPKTARKLITALMAVHAECQSAKTLYLVTERHCEKWQMEGFKAFYKTVEAVMASLTQPVAA
jgi:hypothetical protein